MKNIPVCYRHPTKPARALCNKCQRGICKYCGYNDGQKVYCDECKPNKSNRGVYIF